MQNHCLSKSIADASWSAFFSQLAAKAEEAGRTLVKVNPASTSQTCSTCGHRQKMPLSERVFDCPCCHAHLDRDLNAALNIRALGLQSIGLSVEAPGLSHGEYLRLYLWDLRCRQHTLFSYVPQPSRQPDKCHCWYNIHTKHH